MLKYIIRKFFIMIITLWVIITAVFFIMKVLPGSPFDDREEISINEKYELEIKYGLNKPVYMQYIKYIKDIIRFDLGESYRNTGEKVTKIIKESLKYSAAIGFVSIIVAVLEGLGLSIFLANNNRVYSKIVLIGSTFGVAIPNFVLAILFVYLFSEKWNLLLVGDIHSWVNFIGPIIILSIYPASFIIKIVNSNMSKILKRNYINIFRVYGISEKKILFKYAMREVLIPVVTYIAPMIASVMMGSFAVEKIFGIPGLGKVFIDGVINRDYNVVFGLILFYAIIYLIVIFVADICYFIIDPRLKLSFSVEPEDNL